MYKVQVNVPAVVSNLGPGLHTLGLALNIHVHIEMSIRQDGELFIHITGEDAESIPKDFHNPVLRAATRLFQQLEVAPAGLNISIHNNIPLGVGLDASAAMIMGGLVAANNLTDGAYKREQLIALAEELGLNQIDALTTLLGGLNVSGRGTRGEVLHKSLEPPPLRVVVVVPDVPDYAAKTREILPENVRLEDAITNMGRIVFLMDGLMAGNYDLIQKSSGDTLFQAAYTAHLPGYEDAVSAAFQEGAAAVTLASEGPAILVFARYNHVLIAEMMSQAFETAGVANCRTWTLGIDAQGVTVSVAS